MGSLFPLSITLCFKKGISWITNTNSNENIDENRLTSLIPVLSMIGLIICLIQPLIALVISTTILFISTIIGKKDNEHHLNYQITIFIMMFGTCAWKFACLFTAVSQNYFFFQ